MHAGQASPSMSYNQVRASLGERAHTSHGVQSVAHFEQQGDRPMSLTQETAKSANLVWKSAELHRTGGLAGYGKINRRSIADLG